MGVNFHTVGNNYDNYSVASGEQTQQAQGAQVSTEYLSIIREFGLEDTAELRQAFDDNPPQSIDMGNLTSLSNKLDSMSGSLADVFTVMALIAKMSQENREAARSMRDAQQQGQLNEMQNAADKVREAADFALAAGIVSGVMKMASGAVSIGGGVKGLKDLKAAGTSVSDSGLEGIRAQGRVFDGSGQVVSGSGDVIAAGLNRAGEEARAEEKEADARGKEAEYGAQKESDFMSSNSEMIQKVANIMRDLIQLNTESEKAAATI